MIEQVCLNEVLIESAKEVFETMVFMDIAAATNQDQDIEGWTLLGSITFKGNIEGCLTICLNVPCAQTIAKNMLGIDTTEQVTEEDTCDAIGEIAKTKKQKRVTKGGSKCMDRDIRDEITREYKEELGL